MGVYNTYGNKINAQLKVGASLTSEHYEIGSKVDIPDGLYITYDGVIIVRHSRLYDEFIPDELFDKWGEKIDLPKLLYKLNPIVEAVKNAKRKYKK